MAEDELKTPSVPAPAPAPVPVEDKNDVAEVNAVTQAPPAPVEKADESKALVVAEKTPDSATMPTKKPSLGPTDRDLALAEVEKGKRLSLIKAWEESEKTRAENKAEKKLSSVASWENTKKASLEAKLKKIEEQLERKKAEYAEKMKNKVALIHKQAEEKKAEVEAIRGGEVLKAEEMAAKFRATGHTPKKAFGCF